jgi:hypothetical protein
LSERRAATRLTSSTLLRWPMLASLINTTSAAAINTSRNRTDAETDEGHDMSKFMTMRELIELCKEGDKLINDDMKYRNDDHALIIEGYDDATGYADDLKITIRDNWLELEYKAPGMTVWQRGCIGDYDRINQFAYEL